MDDRSYEYEYQYRNVKRASAELNTGCHRYTIGGGGGVVVVNVQKASFQNMKPKVR